MIFPFVIFIAAASSLAPTTTCWVFNIQRTCVFLFCCTRVMRYHYEMTTAWVPFIRIRALITGLSDLIKQVKVLQLTNLMPVVIMYFISI